MGRPAEPGRFLFWGIEVTTDVTPGLHRTTGLMLWRSFGALLFNARRLVFPRPSTYLAATDVLFEDRSLAAPSPETELDQGAFTVEPGLFFHQSADL